MKQQLTKPKVTCDVIQEVREKGKTFYPISFFRSFFPLLFPFSFLNDSTWHFRL